MSKFTAKDSFDKMIYRLFNMYSFLLFILNFSVNRKVKKNIRVKNIHNGEQCFILGTGPSLNDLSNNDLEMLKKEITIGVNALYKSDDLNNLVPTYYSLFDNYYWNEYSYFFEEINTKYNGKTTFITSYKAEKITQSLSLKNEPVFMYSKHYPTTAMNFDLTKNTSITMNVVSSSILAAIYMGFKEIYLLGCDYNSFASRKEVHFYDEKDEIESNIENRLGYLLKYYHLTTEFHYLIAKLAKQKNIKIINLSETSLLDAYPMSTFKKVISKS